MTDSLVSVVHNKRIHRLTRHKALEKLIRIHGRLENVEGLRINRFVRSFLHQRERRAKIACEVSCGVYFLPKRRPTIGRHRQLLYA